MSCIVIDALWQVCYRLTQANQELEKTLNKEINELKSEMSALKRENAELKEKLNSAINRFQE